MLYAFPQPDKDGSLSEIKSAQFQFVEPIILYLPGGMTAEYQTAAKYRTGQLVVTRDFGVLTLQAWEPQMRSQVLGRVLALKFS